MPHSFGYRARTRKLFAQPFRAHGVPHLSTYLATYKLGDLVDIRGNGAIHKGMPHKYYHGRTGRVWNVTPRAIGVEVNKRVGNRILVKRIHVRIEHVKKSRSREDFLNRVRENTRKKIEAKKSGVKVHLNLKRLPKQPRKAEFVRVKANNIETITPLKYELLV